MRGYLLQFQESDGSVQSEVMYFKDEEAGLVDPNGRPLSTTESFVMHGRTWRVADVHVTPERVRVICVPTVARDKQVAPGFPARRTAR